MREIVFEVGAEGGSLTIERIRDENGEKFIYHHQEIGFDDGDFGISKGGEYETFEQPFQLINTKFDYWFQLHVVTIHKDYRDYVLEELMKAFKIQGTEPEDLEHSRGLLEKELGVQLLYGHQSLKTDMQNITIENLTKFTEYEHDEYRENVNSDPSNESLFVPKAKFETWLSAGQSFHYQNVKMGKETAERIEITGKLEISGNTIIIKNEFGQISCAFSSDKFFVWASSILSNSRSWYYKRL